jgi:2-polyprenyl-6-hydroxyphenyl methylase/3-demethylubiquinone-9 3-methyltransferase
LGCNDGITKASVKVMTDTAHNVDPGEINKFEKLAARWWDPNSEFKTLHDINPLRLDYIDSRAGLNGLEGKKVLDVGCGGGLLAEAMAARGADVTGIDMGKAPLNVARLHKLEFLMSSPASRCWSMCRSRTR